MSDKCVSNCRVLYLVVGGGFPGRCKKYLGLRGGRGRVDCRESGSCVDADPGCGWRGIAGRGRAVVVAYEPEGVDLALDGAEQGIGPFGLRLSR